MSNSNILSNVLGQGFSSTNTHSSALAKSLPGFSASISNSASFAIGKNASSSAGANAASNNQGASSSAGGNAFASPLAGIDDLSVSVSFASASSVTVGGVSSSNANSVSITHNLFKSNLNGKYNFIRPKVDMQVTQEALIFKGCNTYRVPIIRSNQNSKLGKF